MLRRSAVPSKEEKTTMVWPHNKIERPSLDHPSGNSSGEEEKGAAEKELGRQHLGMDRKNLSPDPGTRT